MWILSLALFCAAVGLLFLHRKYMATPPAAPLGVVEQKGAVNGLLCSRCGAAALANTTCISAKGARSASSAGSSLVEATLRRKRQWVAQRGEDFLRKVMFGQRGQGLLPLPGACCAVCRCRLSKDLSSHSAPRGKVKDDTPASELQFALDMADAAIERQQRCILP